MDLNSNYILSMGERRSESWNILRKDRGVLRTRAKKDRNDRVPTAGRPGRIPHYTPATVLGRVKGME